ncbi:GAF domain-containing protein [Deinococcus sonorensis]|uniref:histidine kinase n=2 Tax=Deinococcus sonorensis TaxID=309891 RepID=A0AAU7U7M0_9DEIO
MTVAELPSWQPPLTVLAQATTVAEFAALLVELVMDGAQAHGARASLWSAESGGCASLAEQGRGLSLCGDELGQQVRHSAQMAWDGMHAALPLGDLLLETVGARPEQLDALWALAPLLTLAFEGVQAREARRGRGRESETVTQLVRRMGGSLELPRVLTATAETAAQALGWQRAFVGLLSESATPGEAARTGDVYTYGFGPDFSGGVGVGPSSFERLFRQGEVIVYDRERDQSGRMGAGLAELDPETAVIAPLAVRGRPLGVLYADTRSRGMTVTPDDLWVVLALAEQASLAIDNARLYGEETRKRQAAEALREVGSALSHSLQLGDTLQAVLERAQSLFGADACAVYELQPDGRTLAIRSAVGLSSEYVLRSRAKLGAGITGRAVARSERVAVRDFPAEQAQGRLGGGSRYTRQLLSQGRYPYRGVVGLPLSARGHAFGGLCLYFLAPLPMTPEELALSEVFAAQASLAIENARLYEEEVRRERESAALLGVARLQSGEEAEDAHLDEVVALAVQAMNAERGLLALFSPAPDSTLDRVAGYRLETRPDELSGLLSQLGRGPRRLSRRHTLAGASSSLIVPLRSGHDTLGFLYADHSGEELPSDRVLQLSRAFADQIALALTRQRLRLALEREEARYRQLAESAHDLIVACDAQGVVTYANPASQRLLGELEGRSMWALVSHPWRAALQDAWLRCLAAPLDGGRCDIQMQGREAEVQLELRLSAVSGGGGMLLVARDISELRRLASEIEQRGEALQLADARQLELRSYLSLFTQAQEEERRRISRELHDDTAQVLVAIARRVDRLSRELDAGLRERAQDIRGDLDAAIQGVRRFARNLRPSVLDDLGLLPALEWLASQAATPTRVEVQGNERRLPPSTELTLFRVVQEALGNIDKHAQASSAAIRVVYAAAEVTVTVSDDGVGFSAEQARERAAQGHLGLAGLRERTLLAGGDLEIVSEPGRGSELRFSLPG